MEKAWTDREIQYFINEADHLLEQIKQNPEMFEESRKRKNVRKGLVTKKITLYYRVQPGKKELQLIPSMTLKILEMALLISLFLLVKKICNP